MPKLEKRLRISDYFGTKQRDHVWGWCAVNDEKRQVFFGLWSDLRIDADGNRIEEAAPDDAYVIQEPHWGRDADGNLDHCRRDQDEKLDLVFDHGYEVFAYINVVEHHPANSGKCRETQTDLIFALDLKRLADGTVVGYPIKRIDIR